MHNNASKLEKMLRKWLKENVALKNSPLNTCVEKKKAKNGPFY